MGSCRFRADELCIVTQADALARLQLEKFAVIPIRIQQSPQPAEVAWQPLKFPAALVCDFLRGFLPSCRLGYRRGDVGEPFIMPGEVVELFEQVVGVFLAVFFNQLPAGNIGVWPEGKILLTDLSAGRRIFQPARALKISARLHFQLREITPAAAEKHADAIVRAGG